MMEVNKICGILILVQGIICAKKKNMFVELNDTIGENISFSDDSKISVKGKGSILIYLTPSDRFQFLCTIKDTLEGFDLNPFCMWVAT